MARSAAEDVGHEIRAALAETARLERTGRWVMLDVETFNWERDGSTPICGEPFRSRPSETCQRTAGAGTSHPGSGTCSRHGGETQVGQRTGAWIVAHAFARALDVTPWEGLLTAVRIAAGRVAFCEAKLAGAYSDRQLEPPVTGEGDWGRAGRAGEDGDNLHFWVKQAELWHDKLARVSALAIQQGVAERLVRQVELEAEAMMTAAQAGLDAAGIEGHARDVLLRAMSAKLLELEATQAGELVTGDH